VESAAEENGGRQVYHSDAVQIVSYFITGTDTGVGKTLVSCALLHTFAAQGKRVAGFKPVAAGCDEDGHNDDAKKLRAASTMQFTCEQLNPYCLHDAIAPHIAAQNEGVHIDLARILTSYCELAGQADEVVVEGAGGFLVPLNDAQDGGDMAVQLGLPIILVVGMRLGCLNHALLTVEAITARGLTLVGWVANVIQGDMISVDENVAALQQRISAPLLGIVPYLPEGDARVAGELLNLGSLWRKL
jgi:dethiobiotin synthetase